MLFISGSKTGAGRLLVLPSEFKMVFGAADVGTGRPVSRVVSFTAGTTGVSAKINTGSKNKKRGG